MLSYFSALQAYLPPFPGIVPTLLQKTVGTIASIMDHHACSNAFKNPNFVGMMASFRGFHACTRFYFVSSSRFVMLSMPTIMVELLCSSAEVDGVMRPPMPRAISRELKPTMKR